MAREQHEATLPSSACCVHFNGAGGNVAAGKYNDGQPHRRQELADRVATAMGEAWADAKANRQPAVAADVGWFIEPVSLPLSPSSLCLLHSGMKKFSSVSSSVRPQ